MMNWCFMINIGKYWWPFCSHGEKLWLRAVPFNTTSLTNKPTELFFRKATAYHVYVCFALRGTVRRSNPCVGRDFPHPSIPALGSTQPTVQCVPGVVPGGKAAGPWRWPPTPSSAEVKESRAIHQLPHCAFVTCSRVTFSFTFVFF